MLSNNGNKRMTAKHSKHSMLNEQTSHGSLQTVGFHLDDVQEKIKPNYLAQVRKWRWLNDKEKQEHKLIKKRR